MTLLSKFALQSYIYQYKNDPTSIKRKFAMIQLSSMAGLRYIISVGVYACTKTYNLQWNNMVTQLNAQWGRYKTMNIDSLCVCPSLVSTPMTGHATKHNSCLPSQTARGSLNDLGTMKISFGSDIHAFWGC